MKKEQIYNIISSSEFAESLHDSTIQKLSEVMNVNQYKPSDMIYIKDKTISKFIFIYSGSCNMINNDNHIIRTINKGDFFGLISLFTNSSKNYSLIAEEETITLELQKEDLESLTKNYQDIKNELLQVVNKRLFNPEINIALQTIAKGVNESTIKELKKNISWKTLNEGEILFNENDVGDSCYVVMSGKVKAIKNIGMDNEIALGELNRGEIIGEMALITGEKRSATIQASKLTRLIYISKDSFEKVMYDNPKALMEVSKHLINRIKYKDKNNTGQKNLIIGIISLLDEEDTHAFYNALNRSLQQFGPTESLNEKNSNIDYNIDNINFEIQLENLISQNDFVILHPNDINNIEWIKRILQYSDQILILGNPKELIEITKKEQNTIGDYNTINIDKYWLILNQDKDIITPENTKRIIDIRNKITTFHIKNNNIEDIKRIGRFITKQTIGLTLGGGGAKGFAHLGVFKALSELNIPIDVIGGTSAGSIIASQIALGNPLDKIIERNKIVNKLNMFKEYGFPYISLIKSKKIEYAAKLSAQDRYIEDLWIPFFAPATDLTNSKLILFNKGPLWEAIRASGALPGIILPYFKENNILVDGGLMNNLPVDIMKSNFGGKIICSSCSSDRSMKTEIKGIPNQAKLFFQKLINKKKFHNNYGYIPNLTDIIFKTSVVASASQLEKNIAMSDVFLELPTNEFGITEFDDKSMLKMIDLGYEYAKPILESFKENLII